MKQKIFEMFSRFVHGAIERWHWGDRGRRISDYTARNWFQDQQLVKEMLGGYRRMSPVWDETSDSTEGGRPTRTHM